MTPTREQVIEWAKAAGIYPANAETIDMISSLAALAYSAGRLKGLDEAKAICKQQGDEWDSDAVVIDKNYAHHCAAAIDQLKEQK